MLQQSRSQPFPIRRAQMPHHAVRVPAAPAAPLGERNLRIPEMQQLQGIAGSFLNRDITRDGGHQLQVEFGGQKIAAAMATASSMPGSVSRKIGKRYVFSIKNAGNKTGIFA